MSKIEAKHHTVEESPATLLGIDTVTPRTLERMIDILAGQDLVLTVIGQSGIGKTAIPKQVAKRRGAPYAAIHMPTATPEDWHLPTMPKDGSRYFDRRIPRVFQRLLDYVEATKKEHGGVVPPDKRPILAMEELNRATDKSVTRGAFVLMGDRMIGDVQLDDSIQIVATMNPSGQGFSVNEFEKDAAMRRRSILVYVGADYGDFMNYAEKAEFHPEVVDYLRAHHGHFYDETAAKNDKVFACPATWESMSRACYAIEAKDERIHSSSSIAIFSGIIGTATTNTFVEFVKNRTVVVSPDDVLYRYGSGSDTRERVAQLLKNNRLDRINDLVTGLSVRVVNLPAADRDPSKIGTNLARFLMDIRPEVSMSFMVKASEQARRGGQEVRQWFEKDLNGFMVSVPEFGKAIKAFHDATKRADEEGKAAGIK